METPGQSGVAKTWRQLECGPDPTKWADLSVKRWRQREHFVDVRFLARIDVEAAGVELDRFSKTGRIRSVPLELDPLTPPDPFKCSRAGTTQTPNRAAPLPLASARTATQFVLRDSRVDSVRRVRRRLRVRATPSARWLPSTDIF